MLERVAGSRGGLASPACLAKRRRRRSEAQASFLGAAERLRLLLICWVETERLPA